MIRLAIVNYYTVKCEEPKDVLKQHFTISDWISALKELPNIELFIFYRFHENHVLKEQNITYTFLKDSLPPELKLHHFPFSYFRKLKRLFKTHQINIIHAHNITDFKCNVLLSKASGEIPIIVQDHGSKFKPAISIKNRVSHYLIKQSLKKVNQVMFSSPDQETAWIEAEIFSREKVVFVLENSSHFKYQDRNKSREITKVFGEPVILWVGNLDENKDPLTCLKAFKEIVESYPNTRLYMLYRFGKLEKEVKQFIEQNQIKEKVTLVGKVGRDEISNYYNSSDYIISASYKEGSGYSVIEAISCGVIPIVSDIPSFRHITNDAEIGGLFTPGVSEELANKIRDIFKEPIQKELAKTLKFFEENLSFNCIARNTSEVYRRTINSTKKVK